MALGYRIPSDYKNDVSKYTHNWRHPAFFTMHPGLAYVTHHRHMSAGDRIRGSISQLVQSQPMQGPLMQGFRMITLATFTPDSIIYGWMRNGIRYSPSQWNEFDKWTFNPVINVYRTAFSDFAAPAVDPTDIGSTQGDKSILAFWLNRGLKATTFQSSTPGSSVYYDLWRTPTYVPDTNADSPFTDNYFSVVGRGGLFDCLGIAPGSVPPCLGQAVSSGVINYSPLTSWDFSIEPWVAYFLSTYYYLANMQEDYMFYSRGAYTLTYTGQLTDYSYKSALFGRTENLGFHEALCGIDPNDFLKFISSLSNLTQSGNAGSMTLGYQSSNLPDSIAAWLLMGAQAHGGLFSVPYRPDFFNNILKIGDSPSVNIPVIANSAAADDWAVAVPDLRFYNKIQNAADRIFVSGGRFGDQLRTLFGTNSSPYTNKPDFLGLWQSSLNPTNTVALAAGENSQKESSSVGQMSARMDSFSDFGGRRIDYYAKEPGTVMFISFLVPIPGYSQGLHPDLAAKTWADEFNPELVGLGFQSVPRWRYSTLPSSFDPSSLDGFIADRATSVDPNLTAVGDTVAWDWLKTDYSRLHGEFATSGYFEYWVLRRPFTDYWLSSDDDGVTTDVSSGEYFGTYINPLSWQYIFLTQSLLDPNFFVGFNFDLNVTSSVPANYMPYLGR